jgi:hypothetical protein
MLAQQGKGIFSIYQRGNMQGNDVQTVKQILSEDRAFLAENIPQML